MAPPWTDQDGLAVLTFAFSPIESSISPKTAFRSPKLWSSDRLLAEYFCRIDGSVLLLEKPGSLCLNLIHGVRHSPGGYTSLTRLPFICPRACNSETPLTQTGLRELLKVAREPTLHFGVLRIANFASRA